MLGIGLLGIMTQGCQPEQNYGDQPSIEFEEYEKLGDDSAVKLVISYVDGDGDLGLKESHDDPPFDSGRYYHNMFIDYYEKINGEFKQVTPDPFSTDTINYNYRFPYITPSGKNKAIKGEISVGFQVIPTAEDNPDRNYDGEIKFEVTIVDRALNESNTVESPAIPFKAE